MKRTFLVLLMAAGAAMPLRAGIVASDSFNYRDGALVGAPGSLWNSHSGTAGTSLVQDLKLVVAGTGALTEDVNLILAGAPYATNGAQRFLYASFKFTCTSIPTGNSTAQSYFAHFKDSTTGGFRCRIFPTTNGLVTIGKLRLAISNGTNSTAGAVVFPLELDPNVEYTVVTRYDVSTTASTLWIDPLDETSTSVTGVDFHSNIAPINIESYAFRQTANQGTSLVENLKVGTSFGDVAGGNTSPVISPVPQQNIAANSSTGPLPFVVSDIETPSASLVVGAFSGNQTLVPDANLTLVDPPDRTITVLPAAGQQGDVTIFVTASDGLNSTTNTFLVRVGAPTITAVGPQSVAHDTVSSPFPFTIGDAETAAADLTVTAVSSDQAIVPNASIAVSTGGANRTATVTPAPGQVGVVTITLTVSDGTQTASSSFELSVFRTDLGLLRSDNFDRADGPLIDFTGSWISNGGTGGTHLQEMQISGGQLLVLQSSGAVNTEDVYTELPPFQPSAPVYATNSGTVFYASLKVTYTQLPSLGGEYFAHFRDDANGFRCKIFGSQTNASAGSFRLGISNFGNSINASSQFPLDLALNTQYTVVVRYDVGSGRSRLWVNPTGPTDTSASPFDNPSPINIVGFAFRQNTGIGSVSVDDLKVGGAFEDVATIIPQFSVAVTRLANGDVKITWPQAATAAGFVLESSLALGSTASWGTVDPTGAEGDQNVLTVSGPAGAAFYQLRK